MNRVSLVKSELINGDANERMSEMVSLEYRVSRMVQKEGGRGGEGGGRKGPKQKLR